MYRKLIKDHKDSRALANSIFRYHAAVALAFAGSSSPVAHGPLPSIPEFCGFGDALHLGTVDIEACHVYHQGFARKLLIPRGLKSFGVSFLIRCCCLLSTMGVSG